VPRNFVKGLLENCCSFGCEVEKSGETTDFLENPAASIINVYLIIAAISSQTSTLSYCIRKSNPEHI
jgi:hypothetical protein